MTGEEKKLLKEYLFRPGTIEFLTKTEEAVPLAECLYGQWLLSNGSLDPKAVCKNCGWPRGLACLKHSPGGWLDSFKRRIVNKID